MVPRGEEAIPFFEGKGKVMQHAMNPADFLLEIVNADFADDTEVSALLDAWSEKEAATRQTADWKEAFSDFAGSGAVEDQRGSAFEGSASTRIATLMKRAFLCYKRDPAL